MRRITLVVAAIFFLVSEAFAAVNVIPKPTRVVEGEGSYTLPSALTISYSDKSLAKAAAYLEEILAPATGFEIRLKKGIKGDVRLVLAAPESAEDESYSFVSDAEGVTITSSGYKGIVHGISTFRQLLPYQIESASVLRGVDWKVPVVRIEDRPAYEWRGLMLDPSRHFYSVKETKDFLDLMALYKFSKFHWHLIDSQAWRIEIRKYPLLTDKGAWRDPANEYIDKACEERADNEHNPAMRLPKEHLRQVDGKTLYGGYYSQEDIREIVEYAAVRGIDVVPEIDMPGHNWMATQCYPWLSCGHDGTDPLCLGSDKVIQFAKDVFKEVFDLFPYSYAEIGGDEVSRKKWEGCPLCQERIRRESLGGLEELQSWFTKEMEKFFNANGRRLIGWDEILEGKLAEGATVMSWRGAKGGIEAAKQGFDVIMTPNTYMYFDYYQSDSTALEPLAIGGNLPVEKVYECEPYTDIPAEAQHHVLGVQANLWTEYIPTNEQLEYMLLPRMSALSEVQWCQPENKNLDRFKASLNHAFKIYDAMGLTYCRDVIGVYGMPEGK